ncbi:MAG TPA: hypothetical protein VGC93_02815 [Thermoanaerobaculia bacterium]
MLIRWLVVLAAIGALILCVLGAVVLHRHLLPMIGLLRSPSLAMPASLEKPRVVTGAGFLTKSEFLRDRRPGVISDISVQDAEIWFAGSLGALVTDPAGAVRSSTPFEQPSELVEMIDVEGDGIVEFLNRGGGWQDVFLLDHEGQVIWTYGGRPSVNGIAAGHLDGDGMLDFVAGFNGDGGVRRINRSAKPVWKESDGNVWHVEIVPKPDGTGGEIVHSNARGEIKIRSAGGKLVACTRPRAYFSDFSLCPWPDRAGQNHLLSAEDDAIWLHTSRGVLVRRFDAPQTGELGEARGLPVVLPGDARAGLAVVVDFDLWDRSILYLYDSRGGLRYQEILAGRGTSLVHLPAEAGEAFLLGGDGRVHLYKVAPAS